MKAKGIQDVTTGSAVLLSPEAVKVAEALKQVAVANPSIQATDIVKGAVEDVKKGLDPANIEKEIQKDVQEHVQEQIKQNVEATTGEKVTDEQIEEYKQENPDQAKQYSLFLDLGRDEPTAETTLLQARKDTKNFFDKTLKYMSDVNNVITDRVKKADKDLTIRLAGIMNGIYTDIRQLYSTTYGKDVPVLYRLKIAFLRCR